MGSTVPVLQQCTMFLLYLLVTMLCQASQAQMTRATACGNCTEVTIASTGGAYHHQPSLLGPYTIEGTIWGDLVPYYKFSNNHFLTPDRFSDPLEEDYLKWIVADIPMGSIVPLRFLICGNTSGKDSGQLTRVCKLFA